MQNKSSNRDAVWAVRSYQYTVFSKTVTWHYQCNYHEAIASSLQRFVRHSEFVYCLSALLEALEWRGKRRSILEVLPHFSDQFDLTNFLNVMARLNYKSRALKTQLMNIDKRLLPCLFLPDTQTAMVVTDCEGEWFTVIDGQTGEKSIINKSHTGQAYFFWMDDTVTANEPGNRGEKKKWFSTMFQRFHMLFVQILCVSLIYNLLVLSLPLFIMAVYDRVIPTQSFSTLVSLVLGVFIAVVSMLGIQVIRSRILSYVGARLDTLVGRTIVERLLYLPPSFTESAAVGAQVSRIKDFDSVREFLSGSALSMLFELPFVIIFIFVIYMIAGPLFVIPIVMVIVFSVFALLMEPFIQKNVTKSVQANIKRQSFQLEALTQMRTIKCMSAEDTWKDRHKDILATSILSGLNASFASIISNSVSDAILLASGLAVVIFGVKLIFTQAMTVGALIATMMLVWRVLMPIKHFFSFLPRLHKVFSSIRQINLLMDLEQEQATTNALTPPPDLFGVVEIQRLSFRYRNDLPPALIGVTATIQPGEVVCIVGRNGSGKSTLLKMIPQLYMPQAGSILINNVDLRQWNPVDLRQSICYLPQQSHLFYGTIAQNIRLANPLVEDKQVVIALKMAGVFDEVQQLPRGIHTRVGDQTVKRLSASFVQRLVLARAYVKRAGLMLFDEPTSSLDFEGDKHFMRMVEHFRGKSTIIIVSHRPTHLRQADKILFLNSGQLLFSGTPDEVLPKIPQDYL